jgi:hypothetical protein
MGMLKVKRKPVGPFWDMVVSSPMVQGCACWDGRRHYVVAFEQEGCRG